MSQLELKARDCAIEARKMNNLNTIEPVDTFKVLKLSNISCIKKPMSKISGIYLKTGKVKVIIINTSKTVGHQHFTAAHELYHCYFDDGLVEIACSTSRFDKKDERELLADLFAAYFLMPEDGILHHIYQRARNIKDIDINDVIFLEQLYGVSHKAMLTRLVQLGLISEDKKEELSPNIRYNARVLGYDDYLYLPTNEEAIISEYAEKIKMAFDKGIITFSRYEELLAEIGLDLYTEEEVLDYVD